jgi:protein-S-isoprenylcysteine O-methyltransferase Ste14
LQELSGAALTKKGFDSSAIGLMKQNIRDLKELSKWQDFLVISVGGLIFAFGLCISLWDFWELQHSQWSLAMAFSGIILMLLGSYLRIESRLTLRRNWSMVVRVLPDHELVTSGIFRHIMHPGYLGEMLIYLSIPVALSSGYGIATMALLFPVLMYRIRIEEKALRTKFGKKYADYSKRTKRLIPYVY